MVSISMVTHSAAIVAFTKILLHFSQVCLLIRCIFDSIIESCTFVQSFTECPPFTSPVPMLIFSNAMEVLFHLEVSHRSREECEDYLADYQQRLKD